jgi:hypothetical protein
LVFFGFYLSDRYQCVPVGGTLFELIAVTRGVMLGSVIETLLFSIFINDVVAICCPDSISVDFICTPEMSSSILS